MFVMKASAGGLAEVSLSKLALDKATDEGVRKFARQMIEDHTKANKELNALADKKGLKVAARMDAKHQKMSDKLSRLSGPEFDRAFMVGQVKDHVVTIALFEKEAKGGMDEDLRAWAKKTLPHLREHLKMAQEVSGKVKAGGRAKAVSR